MSPHLHHSHHLLRAQHNGVLFFSTSSDATICSLPKKFPYHQHHLTLPNEGLGKVRCPITTFSHSLHVRIFSRVFPIIKPHQMRPFCLSWCCSNVVDVIAKPEHRCCRILQTLAWVFYANHPPSTLLKIKLNSINLSQIYGSLLWWSLLVRRTLQCHLWLVIIRFPTNRKHSRVQLCALLFSIEKSIP